MERSKSGGDESIKILRKAPLIDLALEEMNDFIYIDGGTEHLLERLPVSKVVAAQENILFRMGYLYWMM